MACIPATLRFDATLFVFNSCSAFLLRNCAEAWDLATVNRLDLNVLADYRWPCFLGQADAFVEQVGWVRGRQEAQLLHIYGHAAVGAAAATALCSAYACNLAS